jgi:hypothetical protein
MTANFRVEREFYYRLKPRLRQTPELSLRLSSFCGIGEKNCQSIFGKDHRRDAGKEILFAALMSRLKPQLTHSRPFCNATATIIKSK